ncbi:hypothetical protein ACVDG8_009210 [Mesorhizobium sp. ORM8.1]
MSKEVRPHGHFLTARHQAGVVSGRFHLGAMSSAQRLVIDILTITMRRLEECEKIGPIGYPGDGDYIAVLGDNGRENWLLGGEPCGLDGAVLADQAAALPTYYPHGSRLVLVTIRDNWIVALRDFGAAETSQNPNG